VQPSENPANPVGFFVFDGNFGEAHSGSHTIGHRICDVSATVSQLGLRYKRGG
jgi:hypothetical protein